MLIHPCRHYIYRDSSFSSTKSVNNKKTIEAFLSEEDMKKLYESDSAKVVFDKSLFTYDYTRDRSNTYAIYPLVPVLSINLNKEDFSYELEKCTQKYNKYIKEYNDYHSQPLNRLKSFFNF